MIEEYENIDVVYGPYDVHYGGNPRVSGMMLQELSYQPNYGVGSNASEINEHDHISNNLSNLRSDNSTGTPKAGGILPTISNQMMSDISQRMRDNTNQTMGNQLPSASFSSSTHKPQKRYGNLKHQHPR